MSLQYDTRLQRLNDINGNARSCEINSERVSGGVRDEWKMNVVAEVSRSIWSVSRKMFATKFAVGRRRKRC